MQNPCYFIFGPPIISCRTVLVFHNTLSRHSPRNSARLAVRWPSRVNTALQFQSPGFFLACTDGHFSWRRAARKADRPKRRSGRRVATHPQACGLLSPAQRDLRRSTKRVRSVEARASVLARRRTDAAKLPLSDSRRGIHDSNTSCTGRPCPSRPVALGTKEFSLAVGCCLAR